MGSQYAGVLSGFHSFNILFLYHTHRQGSSFGQIKSFGNILSEISLAKVLLLPITTLNLEIFVYNSSKWHKRVCLQELFWLFIYFTDEQTYYI